MYILQLLVKGVSICAILMAETRVAVNVDHVIVKLLTAESVFCYLHVSPVTPGTQDVRLVLVFVTVLVYKGLPSLHL